MRDNQYTIDGRIRFSEVDHTRRITRIDTKLIEKYWKDTRDTLETEE